MTQRIALLAVIMLGAGVMVRAAYAQELDLLGFQPTAAPSPALTIESAEVPHGTQVGLGLAADYAHGLLQGVVDDLGQLDVLTSLSLYDALQLGLVLPLAAANTASDTHHGLGDVRLSLTAPLLRDVMRDVLPFAFTMTMTLPTASPDTWSGSRSLTFTPAFVLQKTLGHVTLSGKAGFVLRRRVVVLGDEQDDTLLLAFGASYGLPWTLEVLTEARLLAGIGGHSFSSSEVPLELDAGLRFDGPWSTRVTIGAGAGGFPLERGVGAPAARVFAAVRGRFGAGACAAGPEDYDGFDDDDACADPDNDADGIPDVSDACPNDDEDRDGFADDDGCPDPDNDADGILDAHDVCPNRSEDRDGFQDQDGCPEPDNDGDKVADGVDVCRLDPEDMDGYQDDDGCPEPGPGRTAVTVEGSRILLSDRIYFDDDADTLRPVSGPVLDELAAALPDLLRSKRLRVEGHTDDSGSADYNLDLSYRRAKAVVEYLKARGVPADRLEHVGRGAQQPLAPNDTPEGRALNRRVELVLIDIQ